jgi:Domain of Unknown Function (DUF1206)
MAVIYAALGVSAASVALGSGASSAQSQEQATSGVLAWPAGRVIVVVAGLIIIGVGVAHVVKGVKKSFAEEIDTSAMSPGAREGVAPGPGRIHRQGGVPGPCGRPAQLCDADLRPAEGARGWTARCGRSWRSRSAGFCSRRRRSDSWPSACSRSSSRDTAGCDPRRSGRARVARGTGARTARRSVVSHAVVPASSRRGLCASGRA